jgi:hypothetical protein
MRRILSRRPKPEASETERSESSRRVEIVVVEKERILMRATIASCPICQAHTELLTVDEAVAIARVECASIHRWLDKGSMHGATMPNGEFRICRNSLLRF